MDYTPDQQKAIQDRPSGNILVSASAGSGKTRVLVDRIINMVETQDVNIDQLLVVTFTNAAAKEMRERLQTALRQEFSKTTDPQKKRHLLAQIQKVAVADITTMDAYCQKLVSRYYYILGIDPNFRILSDDTEKALLKDQVWGNVREDLYGSDADGSFARLTENFSNDRSDEGLTKLVYRMDEFANVNEDPDDWLKKAAEFYEIGDDGLFASRLYQQQIKPELTDVLTRMEMDHRLMIEYAQRAELPKDEKVFTDQLKKIELLETQLTALSTWNDLRQALNQFEFTDLPRLSKASDDQKILHKQIGSLNSKMKDQFKALVANYFVRDEQENLSLMQAAQKRVQKLIDVLQDFRQAYRQTKFQRHLMEFIDIERAAYDILNADSDQARMIQERLRNQYVEIMVDEYQDNNRLQDAILNKIAKPTEGNRFMVGDVKQSIYRFRLADPTMFIEKQHAYANERNDNELITLAENFRSARNIDRFTNLIFEQIMDQEVGNIDYDERAKLKFGATYYPDDLKANVSLILYQTDSSAQNDNLDEQNQIEDSDTGQAEIIAQKIQKLVDDKQPIFDKQLGKNGGMRPVQYGDIVIISPTHNSEITLSDVFTQYGIPAEVSGAKSYFKTTEIQIMMSLLSIIDNPFQDIPLVAVLRSPIVGLDEDQLAYLRINHKTGNYYQAVLDFYRQYPTGKPSDYGQVIYQKVGIFLNQLDHFKDVAQQDGLVALIWDIYNQTGFLDYVGGMPAGYQRQTNLHALYDRAADYEANGFKGLFQFVLFIQRMQKRDDDLATTAPTTSDNMVHVMTIHGSKGLQFPIVFLNDLGKNFNQQDSKGNYILNDRLGVGISYLDTNPREVKEPLQKQAVIDIAKNASLSEEMRKLYVAMTRAEQQLYLVGKIKGKTVDEQALIAKWQSQTDTQSLLLPAASRNAAKSYLDWVGPAISRHPMTLNEFGDSQGFSQFDGDKTDFQIEFYDNDKIIKHAGQKAVEKVAPEDWLKTVDQTKQSVDRPDLNKVAAVLNYQYPYLAATQTTAYQSVSEIKRLFDDPDNVQLGNYGMLDVDQVAKPGRYTQPDLASPKFISGNAKSQPAPTDIGTATHMVLQQIDLSTEPSEIGVSSVIDRLVKQGIILENVAAKINIDGILNFYQSEVGKIVLANPMTTYREAPFSLLMRAKDVFANFKDDRDQRILIHGIMDGYVVTDEGAYLFDYKTDHLTPKTTVKTIVERYRGQIELYGLALGKILGRPVTHKYLYLISDGELITV